MLRWYLLVWFLIFAVGLLVFLFFFNFFYFYFYFYEFSVLYDNQIEIETSSRFVLMFDNWRIL